MQPAQRGHGQANDHAAGSGAQAVPHRAAKEEGEKGGAQQVGQQDGGKGKAPAGFSSRFQLFPGLGKGRRVGAQAAAQAVIQFQLLHIGAVGGGNAADLGPHRPAGGGKADENAVGDDKGVGLRRAVGQQQPLDGLLHPVNFRPALQKAVAQVGGEEEKRVIVHRRHPHHRHLFRSQNFCAVFRHRPVYRIFLS